MQIQVLLPAPKESDSSKRYYPILFFNKQAGNRTWRRAIRKRAGGTFFAREQMNLQLCTRRIKRVHGFRKQKRILSVPINRGNTQKGAPSVWYLKATINLLWQLFHSAIGGDYYIWISKLYSRKLPVSSTIRLLREQAFALTFLTVSRNAESRNIFWQ